MSNAITKNDILAVKMFGTKVVSGTTRYVIPLDDLKERFDFINPKDAGTKYGNQSMKGDGNDVLLLNGLSEEQIKKVNDYASTFEEKTGKPLSKMNLAELKTFMGYLSQNGFNDYYCSYKAYLKEHLTPQSEDKRIGLYTRNKDAICWAVKVPKGSVYKDDIKEQEATNSDSLLVVRMDGEKMDNIKAHITNDAGDYSTLNGSSKIATLGEVRKAFASRVMNRSKSM